MQRPALTRRQLVALVVAGLLLLEAALSFPFPDTVPRFVFLPAPPTRTGPHTITCGDGVSHRTGGYFIQGYAPGRVFWHLGARFDTLEACL